MQKLTLKMKGVAMNIDQDVPVPKVRKSGKRIKMLEAMAVGDSLVLKDLTAHQVRGLFQYAVKKTGYKIIVREIDEGARLWRIA